MRSFHAGTPQSPTPSYPHLLVAALGPAEARHSPRSCVLRPGAHGQLQTTVIGSTDCGCRLQSPWHCTRGQVLIGGEGGAHEALCFGRLSALGGLVLWEVFHSRGSGKLHLIWGMASVSGSRRTAVMNIMACVDSPGLCALIPVPRCSDPVTTDTVTGTTVGQAP